MTDLVTARRELHQYVVAAVAASGAARTVNGSEATGAIPHGDVHATVLLGRGRVARGDSVINATAWQQVIVVRVEIRANTADTRSDDGVELELGLASATIIDAFHADVSPTIGSLNVEFDPLGEAGALMETIPSFVQREGSGIYRAENVRLPFLVFDMWDQAR